MNKDVAYPSSFVGRRALGAQFTKFVLSGGAGTAVQYLLLIVLVKLFALPPGTRVLTGHGPETTVAAEAPSYDEWAKRLDA